MTTETKDYLLLRIAALEARNEQLERNLYQLSKKNERLTERVNFLNKVHKPMNIKVKAFELPINEVMKP
jgi:cell division protein FtsB